MRRWIASSGSCPVAASDTTQTSVRVLRSSPGRVHSVPKIVSVAVSMNLRIIGSSYVVLFDFSTYASPRSLRRISLPFRYASESGMSVSLFVSRLFGQSPVRQSPVWSVACSSVACSSVACWSVDGHKDAVTNLAVEGLGEMALAKGVLDEQ